MASTHIRIPEDKKDDLDELKRKLRKETGEDVTTSDIFDSIEIEDLEEMIKDDVARMRHSGSLFK